MHTNASKKSTQSGSALLSVCGNKQLAGLVALLFTEQFEGCNFLYKFFKSTTFIPCTSATKNNPDKGFCAMSGPTSAFLSLCITCLSSLLGLAAQHGGMPA
jgi:hypothetical protein